MTFAIHTVLRLNWRLWLSRAYASLDSIKLGASHILPYTYFFCLNGIIHTQFSYGFMYTHTIFSYRSLCLLLIILRVYAYSYSVIFLMRVYAYSQHSSHGFMLTQNTHHIFISRVYAYSWFLLFLREFMLTLGLPYFLMRVYAYSRHLPSRVYAYSWQFLHDILRVSAYP